MRDIPKVDPVVLRAMERERRQEKIDLVLGILAIVVVAAVEVKLGVIVGHSLVKLHHSGWQWTAGFLAVLLPLSVWLSSIVAMQVGLRMSRAAELWEEADSRLSAVVLVGGAPVLSVLITLGNVLDWLDRRGVVP